MLLKMLVEKVGGVNNSGCTGMEVGTKTNSSCKSFWGRVGMERPSGAVDEKHLGIGRFTEIINPVLVVLVGCDFNEVHGVTRDYVNHIFGGYCWDLG